MAEPSTKIAPGRDLRTIPKEELEKISKDLKTNIDLELAMGYFEQLLPRIATLMAPALGIDKVKQGMVLLDKKMDVLKTWVGDLKHEVAVVKQGIEDLKYEICVPEEEEEPAPEPVVPKEPEKPEKPVK